ncbi:hypothetical protein ACLB2K_073191 [Fragaria x ananassa]
MALWVRILDLPVKFFKDFTAAKIGKILGDVVKVDPLTIGQSRGKFARVCIEIDLSKPLRPVVEVQNIAYHVVYEGISMICFECGCFGHPKDKCPSIVTAKVDVSSHQDPSEVENVPNAQSEVEMHASEDIVKEDMGPWMLMTYRNKKKNGNSGRSKNLNASGSRFSVLQEEEINEKVPNVENDADMPSGDTPNIVKLWNNFQDKKKKTIDYGYWKAVKASQSGPKISHLFFADDLILFTEASSLQASLHKTCLDNFCALSGQTQCVWIPSTCDLGKYLAIPMYAMQTAKFPVSLCDKLDKLNRDFIWGDVENKKMVHLVNWDTICQPKYLGGLGIKKTTDMNQDMLSKIGWRIFQHDNGLWANVLYAKYLQHGCLFGNDYKPPSDVSSTWRGVMHGAELIKNNLKWRVGNGNSIKF